MAGLVPVAQNTNTATVTIEFEEANEGGAKGPDFGTQLSGRRKLLKGYEQCIGMILVLLISFSTLVALLKDVYEKGHEIMIAQEGAFVSPEVNLTVINNTIKAYFLE